MFTSRAEYRLLLRHDNADRRLTPIGWRVGSVSEEDWLRLKRKEAGIQAVHNRLRALRSEGETLETWLRRTEVTWANVIARCPELAEWNDWPDVVEQVVLEAKYSGYVDRQAAEVDRFRRMEGQQIPQHFDYSIIAQLRHEAREKLNRIRPMNLGQASRISGITPADLAVLLFYLE